MQQKPQNMYLFWWIMTVEFFSPQLCIHLQTDIFEVDFSADIIGHVTLRHIIVCMSPIS